MSGLADALAAIRAAPAGTSLAELARRLGVDPDDLDAMVGYWIHRGELTVAPAAGCSDGACAGCPVARRGCAGPRSALALVAVRPAPPR
jgi:hypothetical protein